MGPMAASHLTSDDRLIYRSALAQSASSASSVVAAQMSPGSPSSRCCVLDPVVVADGHEDRAGPTPVLGRGPPHR